MTDGFLTSRAVLIPRRRSQLSGLMSVLATTTTIVSVHRGVVLPEARVIVIVVPVTVFCVYWFLLRKRPRR
jgi:hypothetical protein